MGKHIVKQWWIRGDRRPETQAVEVYCTLLRPPNKQRRGIKKQGEIPINCEQCPEILERAHPLSLSGRQVDLTPSLTSSYCTCRPLRCLWSSCSPDIVAQCSTHTHTHKYGTKNVKNDNHALFFWGAIVRQARSRPWSVISCCLPVVW